MARNQGTDARVRAAIAAASLAVLAFGFQAPSQATAATSGIRVAGNQLTKDGQPFLPRGFSMIGLLAPDGCAAPPGQAVTARASFGPAELTAARQNWQANTVRFQVSQRGLDPQDPMFRSSYVARIQAGVATARSLGLVVILSMQDQSNGCGTAHPMASDATERAWGSIVPLVKDDLDVMLELFNEPQSLEDAAGWAQWKDGGTGPISNQGAIVVGQQKLVQDLRNLGSKNVLIADGANYAGRLQGLPLLSDPLSDPLGVPQIAYGWHPYFFHVSGTGTLATDQANWDSRTSAVLAAAPVIATEWNASVSNCIAGAATRAPDFLSYLQARRIGLLGQAFDIPSSTGIGLVQVRRWQLGCGITEDHQ